MSAKGKEYKLAVRIAGVVDKSYEAALVSAGAQMKTFKATMGQIDGTFNKLDKGFDKIASVGKKAFHAIATAAGVAAVAVGGVVAKSISIGSEFESEMSAVQSISGATAQELDQLTAKAREVAKESVYSATEVGQAMEYMGMAGWDASQMMSGIEGIIALAAASGEDLAMVSDIVTDSLTAMGQGAEEAGHFADIMAQAATNSNTNVSLMGETFKYVAPVAGALGYSMEDLAIATGTMANSGIKGSLAGTSLRNMLTRMAKPTKESQDAMDALGLSLTDAEGNMNSLLDIMNQLRSAFSGGKNTEAMQSALTELAGLTDEQITEVQDSLGDLSEAEEAFYAAELGGQRGMSGLLAIANATDEEFGKLTDAIYGAEGAAKEMSEVRLDNLQGDVTILKDTLSDSAIEFYYQFNDQLRDVVQGVTGFIGNASDKIPGLWKKISEGFPTVKRKFTQYGEPVLKTLKVGFKWILENGDKVLALIGGIAGGMAAFKIEQGAFTAFKGITDIGSKFVNGTLSFNSATAVIGGIAAAVGLLTTAVINYKAAAREKINNNLAEHFGDLSLTMDEIKEAAAYLTSTDALKGIEQAAKAFDSLEPYESAISDAVEKLNKLNWKVNIGMELTLDEQESYKTSVDQYIKNVQDYAEQARYTASLDLASLLIGSDKKDNILSGVDQFFAGQYDELARIGTEMSEVVTKAFEDGFLDIDEAATVTKLQQQAAEIQKQLAAGELAGNFALIGQQYGGALTPESFQNLEAGIAEAVAQNTEAIDEVYKRSIGYLNTMLQSGELTQAQYNAQKIELDQGRLAEISEVAAQGLQFSLDTIMQQYDIAGLNEQLSEIAQESVNKYLDPSSIDFGMVDNAHKFDAIIDDFNRSAGELIGSTDLDAIAELLPEIQAVGDQLEEQVAAMKAAGQEVPESIAASLSQWEELNTLLDLDLNEGSTDQANAVLQYVQEVIGSGNYDEILNATDEWGDSIGAHIPESLQAGIDAHSAAYSTAAQSAYTQTKSAIDQAFATPFEIQAKLNITPQVYQSSPSYWRTQYKQKNPEIGEHADGGFVQSKELSWLAEKGPEVVIPLDQSRNAIDLWTKTGQMLGMDSLADRFDLSGSSTTNNATITYSPTLQFYGEAPSRKDLDDALHMSQDEFNDMMDQYIKQNDRVSFR